MEASVLDLGGPTRVAEVARQLISSVTRDINVVFTGLVSGERLHEEHFGPGEDRTRAGHSLIGHVTLALLEHRAVDEILRQSCDALAPSSDDIGSWEAHSVEVPNQ